MRPAPILLPLLLAACALPRLDIAEPEPTADGRPPQLIPFDAALEQIPRERPAAAAAPALRARADALAARAAALRGTALTPAERRRVTDAPARLRQRAGSG